MRKVTLIIGPQGSGKTTLAKEMAGKYKYSVEIDAYDKPELNLLTTDVLVIDEANRITDVEKYINVEGFEHRNAYARSADFYLMDIIIVSDTLTAEDFKDVENFECIELKHDPAKTKSVENPQRSTREFYDEVNDCYNRDGVIYHKAKTHDRLFQTINALFVKQVDVETHTLKEVGNFARAAIRAAEVLIAELDKK